MNENQQSINGCCFPDINSSSSGSVEKIDVQSIRQIQTDAVSIPGGSAFVGTSNELISGDGEKPLRRSKIKPYLIGATTITNEQYEEFVAQTGYTTEAEQMGWSFVFWSDVAAALQDTQRVASAEWWRRVDGANWQEINGPTTRQEAYHPDHPVVHVSWHDAQAYATWVGGRLPTETEWEHAARGGLGDVKFPWGDREPDETDHLPCNIWQGQFPVNNTCADGFATTAPARYYEPNTFGMFNMVGNVWEWTADVYKVRSMKKEVRKRLEIMKGAKLLKGGSFLCHESYCHRYRIAARTGNSPDSSTSHQGFRVVWDHGEPSRTA